MLQTSVFKWAVDANDSDGNPLKAVPPLEFQQTGLLKGEPWPRLWHNQMVNNFSLWIQHLTGNTDDGGAEPVGTIKLHNTASQVITPEDRWEGTWVSRGTQTMGTVTATVYEKTAL